MLTCQVEIRIAVNVLIAQFVQLEKGNFALSG